MSRPTVAEMAALQRELEQTKDRLASAQGHAKRLMTTAAEFHDLVLCNRGVFVECRTSRALGEVNLATAKLIAALTMAAEGGTVH